MQILTTYRQPTVPPLVGEDKVILLVLAGPGGVLEAPPLLPALEVGRLVGGLLLVDGDAGVIRRLDGYADPLLGDLFEPIVGSETCANVCGERLQQGPPFSTTPSWRVTSNYHQSAPPPLHLYLIAFSQGLIS
jgi:hypothetical protein